jgi:hypothetical protein
MDASLNGGKWRENPFQAVRAARIEGFAEKGEAGDLAGGFQAVQFLGQFGDAVNRSATRP